MKNMTIPDGDAGGRFDKYVMKYLNEAPKGFIYKMMRKKNITLNGKKAAGGEILKPGDRIEIFLSDETADKFSGNKDIDPNAGEIDILYEDENIIAVNKPAGTLTHGASPADTDTMANRLIKYFRVNGNKTEVFTPAFCNRLDRNTTGVLIGGKNLDALRQLSRSIRERHIRRFYLAAVYGVIHENGRLCGLYRKDRINNTAFLTVGAEAEDTKTARLEYIPLISEGGYTLVRIELITGRSHQIRAQMAAAGYPVAGDPKYKYAKERCGIKLKRQMLHAEMVSLYGLEGRLFYLNGKTIKADKPKDFLELQLKLFGEVV